MKTLRQAIFAVPLKEMFDLDKAASNTLPNGAPRFYFRMHNDESGVDINLKADYKTTPLGVYAYPLTPEYLKKWWENRLPYMGDAKHTLILEATQPHSMFHLKKGSETIEEYRNLVRGQGLSPSQRRKALLEAGYTSVMDDGTGTIHEHEPFQCVFLTAKAFKSVISLPTRRSRMMEILP